MTNRGWCTTVLVEALLNRGRDGDLGEAQNAIDNLAETPTEPGFVYHQLPLLRLNALLAKARGDDDRYRDFRERYRARAESSGFEGHIALAHAMVQQGATSALTAHERDHRPEHHPSTCSRGDCCGHPSQ
jgi:adenylate cyclase